MMEQLEEALVFIVFSKAFLASSLGGRHVKTGSDDVCQFHILQLRHPLMVEYVFTVCKNALRDQQQGI